VYHGGRGLLPVYDHRILATVNARDQLAQTEGFDWDAGNRDKNREKHDVEFWEAEEVFFHRPLVVRVDPERSDREPRFYALGRSSEGRYLFLAFTVRRKLVRVISARDMTRRELAAYAQHHEDEADP
jgi:uncharacterized protein